MNQYSQASLSPLPSTPIACNLPYGLAWRDLQPVLPGFDAQGLDAARAWISHSKQGLNGGSNSCILTLDYPDDERNRRSVTVFIKSSEDPRAAEAAWYRFLAARGIPTPRLILAVERGGREVIVLEFLTTIGIDFASDRDLHSTLDLVAKLSAIADPPDELAPAHGPAQASAATDFDATVLAALTEASRGDDLGFQVDAQRLFEAYLRSQRAYRSLPLGLTHGQFNFQQIGWADRDAGRQLVVFDLATMALRPRFVDIANVLPSLEALTVHDQAGLFARYLALYCAYARSDVPFDHAMRELRLARITESFWSLPWHVAEARQPSSDVLDGREMVRGNLKGIRDDLMALGVVV